MRPSSFHAPITPSRARNCLLINQFATPGLGSLMGRRFVAGTAQLVLSATGFVVVCGWFFRMIWQFYQLISDQNADPKIRHQTLGIGAAVFFVSWVWAWFTSISLLREAKRNEREGKLISNDPVPPRL